MRSRSRLSSFSQMAPCSASTQLAMARTNTARQDAFHFEPLTVVQSEKSSRAKKSIPLIEMMQINFQAWVPMVVTQLIACLWLMSSVKLGLNKSSLWCWVSGGEMPVAWFTLWIQTYDLPVSEWTVFHYWSEEERFRRSFTPMRTRRFL